MAKPKAHTGSGSFLRGAHPDPHAGTEGRDPFMIEREKGTFLIPAGKLAFLGPEDLEIEALRRHRHIDAAKSEPAADHAARWRAVRMRESPPRKKPETDDGQGGNGREDGEG